MLENEQVLNNLETLKDKNMSIWFGRVSEGIPKEVAELHAEEGLFDPTLMGNIMHGQEGAETYHKHFLAKKPVGELVSPENDVLEKIGENAYIHQGEYKFVFDGDESNFAVGDFSYIWKKDKDGKFQIAYHHSSILPTEEQKKIIESLKDNLHGTLSEEHYLQIDDQTKLHIGRITTEDGDVVRFSQLEDENGVARNKHFSFRP